MRASAKNGTTPDNAQVHNLIDYIEKTGQMRDAQIEAIKVYLFLKIGCQCQPLSSLFTHGVFNNIVLDTMLRGGSP